MPDSMSHAKPATTLSEDYSSTYYNDAHLGGYDNYSWENEEWRKFFLVVAERVVGAVNPGTVLDVGCARGLLVQALAQRNVDARGIDISEHAIASAHPEVRERLSVASAAEPFAARYDLITCIEVLEHMSPLDAQLAMDNMTAVTDRVLFSSSPGDFDEPTHINTHPSAAWAAWFAERGFFRRTDVDLSFLAPWAVLFERADVTLHGLAQRYEHQYARISAELLEKRSALLESHRRIGSLNEQLEKAVTPKLDQQAELVKQQAALVEQWEDEVLQARHQLLTTRDHVVGKEAEVARLTQENANLLKDLTRAQKQLINVRTKLRETRRRARRLQARLQAANAKVRTTGNPSFARRVARRVLAGSR